MEDHQRAVIRDWPGLVAAVASGHRCLWIDSADAPIRIPAGHPPVDLSGVTLLLGGAVYGGPVVIDATLRAPPGLRILVDQRAHDPIAAAAMMTVLPGDGATVVEFRADAFEPVVAAFAEWSREHAAEIEASDISVDARPTGASWLLRVTLVSRPTGYGRPAVTREA